MEGCRVRAEEWPSAGRALDTGVALAQATEEAGWLAASRGVARRQRVGWRLLAASWMAVAGREQRSEAAPAELSTAEEWLVTASPFRVAWSGREKGAAASSLLRDADCSRGE
ncbi:unnamed protein product [Linum trigynum]|uniref:Uncharacterized protein n=1 Tax=Linum trigynum TaxID=586398 RepID=A0AAV2CNW2_9ROSI